MISVSTPTVVYVAGAFDSFNIHHLHFLQTARSIGDSLIVGILGDKTIQDLWGTPPLNPQAERLEIVGALSIVSEAWYQDKVDTLPNLVKISDRGSLLTVVLGRDQNHIDVEGAEARGIKVVRVPVIADALVRG